MRGSRPRCSAPAPRRWRRSSYQGSRCAGYATRQRNTAVQTAIHDRELRTRHRRRADRLRPKERPVPEMLIGGEWRQATAHEEIEVVNPATEEVVDTVPAGSPEDVELAVATAKRAFARVVAHRRRETRGDPGQGRRPDPRERQGTGGDADLRAGQAAGRGRSARSATWPTASGSMPRRRRRSAAPTRSCPRRSARPTGW